MKNFQFWLNFRFNSFGLMDAQLLFVMQVDIYQNHIWTETETTVIGPRNHISLVGLKLCYPGFSLYYHPIEKTRNLIHMTLKKIKVMQN